MGGPAAHERRVVADLLSPGDKVVLVVPIDSSAPKGRIILPQQLVLRDVLDAHASAMVCQPGELAGLLAAVHDVRLVITDSQAFQKVASIVPETTPLTSFSLLMARYKGDLRTLVEGAAALGALTDESRVLISEGCTHHAARIRRLSSPRGMGFPMTSAATTWWCIAAGACSTRRRCAGDRAWRREAVRPW